MKTDYCRPFLALDDLAIRKIMPQITSAVIPKKIQSDVNTERVSTATDVITRANDDHAVALNQSIRTKPTSGRTSSTSGNAG